MKNDFETDPYGTRRWYQNHQLLHRTDGPAIEWVSGNKYWYQNGQRHRTDGPAIEYANGTKAWYQNDKLHRTDGPAVEWVSGNKSWYIDNIEYTEEEFREYQLIIKLAKI